VIIILLEMKAADELDIIGIRNNVIGFPTRNETDTLSKGLSEIA
jgi:hypothetical protein